VATSGGASGSESSAAAAPSGRTVLLRAWRGGLVCARDVHVRFGSACNCELRTEPGSAFERPNAPEIAE
jgi:hypothetical protein